MLSATMSVILIAEEILGKITYTPRVVRCVPNRDTEEVTIDRQGIIYRSLFSVSLGHITIGTLWQRR